VNGGKASNPLNRADAKVKLRLKEESVKRDRFGKSHTDDGLDEDTARSSWIASNCFSRFRAD
jgi:hypothetical protein